MFNKITAEYYGAQTPLTQMAGFAVPEARLVVITPYDKSSMTVIEKAIRDSDLGVNPSNDGVVIRVAFPQLTEERRKDYIKVARTKAEDGQRGRRGRGAPGREDAGRPHPQVRRPDRRAAQAQGGRAARGLMTSRPGPP
jgi:hypothetical protein